MTLRVAALFLVVVAGALACSKDEPAAPLGKLPEFSLVDQGGQPFTRETLKGKVWVAAFMFTRCPTVCPALTRGMQLVQANAKSRGVNFHLVSFSVDPEHDSPEVLREYARKYGADLSEWTFVTGDSHVIQQTAEQGFKIGLSGSPDESKEHFGITHGSHLVLVDKLGQIRGYYRSSEPEQLDALVEEARRLQ